jgi:hypothetical protein
MAVVVMVRYPVFSFEDDDIWVFDSPDDVRHDFEVYDIDKPGIILDSDGRELTASESGGQVILSRSDTEPDPELLRRKLINALRRRGQTWSDDATLGELIPEAQATWWKGMSTGGLRTAFFKLLRLLRMKRPQSPGGPSVP